MDGGHEKDTNTLIQEMMKQMTAPLQEKVDAMQKNPPTVGTSESNLDSDDEMEDSSGRLVQLSETTRSFWRQLFRLQYRTKIAKSELEKSGYPTVTRFVAPSWMGF